MADSAYLTSCCDGSIRIFSSKAASEAWDRGAMPKIHEGMQISAGELAKHWRGRLPKNGAVFTPEDISFCQLMAKLAWD